MQVIRIYINLIKFFPLSFPFIHRLLWNTREKRATDNWKKKQKKKKQMIKRNALFESGLISWHFNKTLRVYFNCLVTCKTYWTRWVNAYCSMVSPIFNEQWENFVHYTHKLAPVQCVTTDRNVERTVNLWSFAEHFHVMVSTCQP